MLQLAQQHMAAKQYEKALRLLTDLTSEAQPPPVTYFLRGTIYEQKQMFEQALDDFAQTISITQATTNVHERSQRKMYEICKQNCQINCPKKYPSQNFPTYKTYQDLKQLFEDHKNLLDGNHNLQQLQKHVEICRFDSEIQQKILSQSIQNGNYNQAKQALTILKQANQDYKYEIQSLISIMEMFEAISNENNQQVQTIAKQLIKDNQDEPAFNQLLKISQFLQSSFQLFQQLTPNAEKNGQKVEGLDNILNQIDQMKRQLKRSIDKLQTKIQSILQQILRIESSIECPLDKIKEQLEKQLNGLLCGAEYFTKQDQSHCSDMEAQSPTAKYLKALILSITLSNDIKSLTRRYSKDEEVSDEIEDCDRKIAQIHNLLKEVFDKKTGDDQFPNLVKFVDEVNSISDKVLALQLKVITPNFYRILNVSRKATSGEIKKSYFKLAKQYHPDRISPDTPEEQKKKIANQFQKIAEAYDVLSDDQKRAQYDQGQYGQDVKQQKQANHQQRKERAKQQVQKREQQQFNGQSMFGGQGGQQQFFFGGDPFQFFQNFGGFNFGGFGGQQGGQEQQQQQQQQQGGGQRRVRININGQDFFM